MQIYKLLKYTVFLMNAGLNKDKLRSNCKYIYGLRGQEGFRCNNFHSQVHTGALSLLIPKPDIQILFCQGWGLLLLHYGNWQVLETLYNCS